MNKQAYSLDTAWLYAIGSIMRHGDSCAPRGEPILEVLHQTLQIDMRFPVLLNPLRKLGYRFMLAEAAWILSGSDKLAEIEPWAKRMREFSDNGIWLAGAYGPRFVQQIDHVVSTLNRDLDSRQATITFWRPNPLPSRDIPCTVAADFKVRKGELNLHVFMRSSDAWLGLPYDTFSFTMMACAVLAKLRVHRPEVTLGRMFLTMASSHLYAINWQPATEALNGPPPLKGNLGLPERLLDGNLVDQLRALRDAPNREGWWWQG